MMARKNGVGQIIEAGLAVVALIALTSRFRVIKAALHDLGGLTRWTRHAVWPAQLADNLIALHIINEIHDIDLQHWTPVKGWELRCHQYRTSSHATTLESDKSVSPRRASRHWAPGGCTSCDRLRPGTMSGSCACLSAVSPRLSSNVPGIIRHFFDAMLAEERRVPRSLSEHIFCSH